MGSARAHFEPKAGEQLEEATTWTARLSEKDLWLYPLWTREGFDLQARRSTKKSSKSEILRTTHEISRPGHQESIQKQRSPSTRKGSAGEVKKEETFENSGN